MVKLLFVKYFQCACHALAEYLVFWHTICRAGFNTHLWERRRALGWGEGLSCGAAVPKALSIPQAALQLDGPSALSQIQARQQTFVPISTSHVGHPW